eukprot:1302979-Rhodomonas_salina.2
MIRNFWFFAFDFADLAAPLTPILFWLKSNVANRRQLFRIAGPPLGAECGFLYLISQWRSTSRRPVSFAAPPFPSKLPPRSRSVNAWPRYRHIATVSTALATLSPHSHWQYWASSTGHPVPRRAIQRGAGRVARARATSVLLRNTVSSPRTSSARRPEFFRQRRETDEERPKMSARVSVNLGCCTLHPLRSSEARA